MDTVLKLLQLAAAVAGMGVAVLLMKICIDILFASPSAEMHQVVTSTSLAHAWRGGMRMHPNAYGAIHGMYYDKNRDAIILTVRPGDRAFRENFTAYKVWDFCTAFGNAVARSVRFF